jgi:hypothetical protein
MERSQHVDHKYHQPVQNDGVAINAVASSHSLILAPNKIWKWLGTAADQTQQFSRFSFILARVHTLITPKSVSLKSQPKCINGIWMERSKHVEHEYTNENVQKFVCKANRSIEVLTSKFQIRISLTSLNHFANHKHHIHLHWRHYATHITIQETMRFEN